MKFYINVFLSKCDSILSFLRIWSDLLKKSFMDHFFSLCSVGGNFLRNFLRWNNADLKIFLYVCVQIKIIP